MDSQLNRGQLVTMHSPSQDPLRHRERLETAALWQAQAVAETKELLHLGCMCPHSRSGPRALQERRQRTAGEAG